MKWFNRIKVHYSLLSIVCPMAYYMVHTSDHGRCSVRRVEYGPPKTLVGWATVHLASPWGQVYCGPSKAPTNNWPVFSLFLALEN